MKTSFIIGLAATTLLLGGCTTATEPQTQPDPTDTDHARPAAADGFTGEAGHEEVQALPNRVAITARGVVITLNPFTGEELGKAEVPGNLQLSPAGDGRHVLITSGEQVSVLDVGLVAKPHGQHFHYYVAPPELLDTTLKAPHAGAINSNEGHTAVFSDSTGIVKVFESAHLGNKDLTEAAFDTGAAHAGVALPFADGTVVTSRGTDSQPAELVHMDRAGSVIGSGHPCPEASGVATVAPGVAAFGCAKGVALFAGGKFSTVPLEPGASDLAGSAESSVVLAGNPGARSFTLLDTKEHNARTVELDSAIGPHSLARGPLGEALVLASNGTLTVYDADTGQYKDSLQATAAWDDSAAAAQLISADGYAFIIDPAQQELVVVDLLSWDELYRHHLDFVPEDLVVL
ncbi:hypothetical protein CPHO_08675 [Corynebacterium phocae]|uniref:ABC transporter n=1 Tax=Corynebacterium phocae TaxID=161895 RepID=A0A1L7D4A7_9CORY|nr:hypothetical protein [Corynebacterium phocae]APT92950.1 hypothetical protein CPHO_08675 [Corynebacterium phocae]KAA8723283.1 hypothetical protein F4V58_08180 [Corynebacterium phocae]